MKNKMMKITGLAIEVMYIVFTIYMLICYGVAISDGHYEDVFMDWEITMVSMAINCIFVLHIARLAIQSWREGRKSK